MSPVTHRIVFAINSQYDHATSLLKELHWLRVPERIEFKLCALVYKCLNGSGLTYPSDSLQRSCSSSTLVVPVTRRATLADGRPGMERSSADRLIVLH